MQRLMDQSEDLHCLWLFKLSHALDVIHEVSSINVFHHKVQPIL